MFSITFSSVLAGGLAQLAVMKAMDAGEHVEIPYIYMASP